MRTNGALDFIGRRFTGVLADIAITETGLIAAAHRHGPGAVRRYLRYRFEEGSSVPNMDNVPEDLRRVFKEIEKRLRIFEAIQIDGSVRLHH
jgi:hypothetical protein